MNFPGDKLSPASDSFAFLAGGGEMGSLIRAMDWSQTSLGSVAGWPQSLRTTVSICLASDLPICVIWGPGLVQLYNDAYRAIIGDKHPRSMGQNFSECFKEAWPVIGQAHDAALAGNKAFLEAQQIFLERRGYVEETFFTFSFSPIRDEAGRVGGLFHPVIEMTAQMLSERRTRALRDLAAQTGKSKSVSEALSLSTQTLARYDLDLPFALLYVLEPDVERARLVGATGLQAESVASASTVYVGQGEPTFWPLEEVVRSGAAVQIDNLAGRIGPAGRFLEPPNAAFALPIIPPGADRPAAILIAGISPRLPMNEAYRDFYDLLTSAVTAAVANARAFEDERRRAKALADLDRAKIAFFSNVSHEFRTPLTLMLGPVEDALAASSEPLPPLQRERLEVVYRNGLRLQRLVNSLLDFSRIEAGRVRAAYEPTALAYFTADLASNFRAACEKAGLQLRLDCPPLSEPVFVDRSMWEKIVLNLLSNAFKFTFEGEISVSMRQTELTAELCVRDTGTGVPVEEIPLLFERFHRVENARGRTHEGSGIGLSLVQEVVKLHGGLISAESEVGRGSTFTVSIPLGSRHLPQDQVGNSRAAAQQTALVSPFVEEALGWLPDSGPRPAMGIAPPLPRDEPTSPPSTPALADEDRPLVLVVDDNADMRRYVVRLLAPHYRTEAVPDGEAALAAVRQHSPDLVLADVMMPGLDGFGLLQALRADPQTSGVPVIMLSARAGEESRIEGLREGADDYLVKPFSAKELLARVSAHLKIARIRLQASEALRASEAQFRALVSASSDVVYRMNADWTEMRQLQGREFIADTHEPERSWLEKYIQPGDQQRVIEAVREAVRTRSPFELEHQILRIDGTLGWTFSRAIPLMDDEGTVVEWLGMASDVTARKQAQEALRESEERRRLALDAAELGTWHVDPVTRATKTDARYRAIFGTTEEWTDYLQAVAVIHPDDRRAVLEAVAAATRLDDPAPYAIEYRITHSDGSLRWVFAKGRSSFEETGPTRRVKSFDGTVADITDRKLGEEERERLVARLREQDQRKDEFLATLAHELRNPLAPIRNGLQILRLTRGDTEKIETVRLMMERQVSQMVHLIDDLLDLSRISRGKIDLRKERIELARVIERAVEASRPAIENAGHGLVIEVPPEAIYVDADLTRLTQVFSNLLNNAAKFTERGGRVQLAVQLMGAEAVVSVADNGIGIPTRMLSRVFEMFTQVDGNLERSQGGLGIGLSIVQQLVQMHGGAVEARSDGLGKGSEFVVRLPLALSLVGNKPADEAHPARPAASLRILVADDNFDSAKSLAMLLMLEGHQTRTAHDGQEALDVAALFKPDAILLDIGMPKLNGYEVCRRLRQLAWGKSIVVIALSGWGQDEDKRRSLEAGIDSHLVKPVDHAALQKLLIGVPATRA
ncbi:ATP-binding protein [Polaromonas sp.]|uniref:ATP-binding protein n=1 Tax=Polaromonas sp. TaxID=1869339 RepID=UPI0037521500